MALTPISSVENKDGTFTVTYQDSASGAQSTKVLKAPEAQAQKVLPGDVAPASVTKTGGPGSYGGGGAFGSSAIGGGGAVPATVYDPNSGSTISGTAGIPIKQNGRVVGYKTIGSMVTESRANLAQIRNAMVQNGVIGKNVKSFTQIQNQWIQVLLGAQATQMDPNEYMATLKSQGFGGSGTQTRTTVTDLTPVADGYFYKVFSNVFDRMPTQMDTISPFKDKAGKPLTWTQALIAESKKPGNAAKTTATVNPDGTVSNEVVTPGFDPETWLQKNLTDFYSKAIKEGKTSAQQSDIDKYTQLAQAYGINVIDPKTKQLDVNSRLDLAGITGKTTDWSTIQNNFKNAALAQYGHLKSQIVDSNLNLKQIAAPAINMVAKILEKDPNTITLDDPYVQKYLSGDGKSVLPVYQLEHQLRKDPTWPYTDNARSQFEGLSTDILTRFGMIG